MKNLIIVGFLVFTSWTYAQVGINTTTPIDQSSLQIEGANTGVLINRVSLSGCNDTSTIANLSDPTAAAAANGLLVYNTATTGTGSNAVKPGFYNWNGTSWTRLINEDTISDYTGWGVYNDTQFTEASPGIVAANTLYFLPNNAGSKIESQKPIDIDTFYDETTQKITGRNGDGLNVVIEFRLKPNTNSDTRVTLSIDIGGTVGEIYKRDFVLTKGQNIEHFYLSSFDAYTLNTWEANGGSVLIRSSHAISIYNIRYLLTRTHKAR